MLRERRLFSNYPQKERKILIENQNGSDRKSKFQQVFFGDEITIKFVGNMDENIDEIVNTIKCPQSSKQDFKSILKIYANKIVKLREQRNFYKELLCLSEQAQTQQKVQLKQRMHYLQSQLQQRKLKSNCERCTCFDESQFQTSKFLEYQEGSHQFSRATVQSFSNDLSNAYSKSQTLQLKKGKQSQDQMLISKNSRNQDSLLVSESLPQSSRHMNSSQLNASISQQQLMKLMMKYNINTQQLEQIFQEYDRENKQAYQLFDSQRQRELYRLGQRMQKDLWNKKIIKDIKKLV